MTIDALLIEDDPDFAKFVELQLKSRQNVVSVRLAWCTRMEEAKSFLEENSVDVILSDLTLSDSKGLETVETLHQYSKQVPIVVLSASDNDELMFSIIRNGAYDHLVKGQFFAGQLLGTMLESISRRILFE